MNSEDGLKKSGLNRGIMVSLAEFVFYQGSEKNVIQIYNEWSQIHHFYQPDPDLAAGIITRKILLSFVAPSASEPS